MPRFKVAHVREQGVDLIIVPLDDEFARFTDDERAMQVTELQMAANSAGLVGTIVPVWNHHGKMGFIAPQPWHPFFRGLSLAAVMRMTNRELSW